MIKNLLCALGLALVLPGLALAFPNTEPLSADQWYLTQDHAWSYWPSLPQLKEVKVAVIDSGIDYGHPEFAGRIVAGRSFVRGSWKVDTDGHGTFVAGLIAANPTDGQGIAGLAFNARLLIAKVVPPGAAGVDLKAEVRAIDWAVGAGAQVINLSLGGTRDPEDARLDSFSPLERAAVEYAISKGVVVVAAAGNGTDTPSQPWPFADWPAALPHVIGVGALRQDGSVPTYSNRDPVYVDIAAPGDGIVSTIPRNLVDATQPGCAGMPYSPCGPSEFRDAIGTSFAAPQVSAAAALLLGADPSLTNDQVVWLLERSARDVNATNGCPSCAPGRDALTGWGRLDVRAALALAHSPRLPTPDFGEPNDDAGPDARPIGSVRTIRASLDGWDDPIDVYSLRLERRRLLYARLSPSNASLVSLVVWKPGTLHVEGTGVVPSDLVARAVSVGGQKRLSFVVPATGTYYLEVRFVPNAHARVTYTLSVATKG